MELTSLQLKLRKLMSVNDRRSIRELCQATGASSTSMVRYNLLRLADEGLLTPPPHGQSRMWVCVKAWTADQAVTIVSPHAKKGK